MTTSVRYRYTPVPFTAVEIADQFWLPRLQTNRAVTIPYDFKKCEETGRITNFDKAAGTMPGDHEGIFYNDSDVYKIIEGAAYSLSLHPDPELDAYLDDLIAKIAAAQEEDGYLYTPRTIAERTGRTEQLDPEREGLTRWSNLRVNHELYNVGHLYEAAVAHYHATSKRSLLDVAIKNADLIDQVFGPHGRHDVPGHQEIEIGLAKLYRVTGEQRYLSLAKFFLDERGHAHDRALYQNHANPGYMQDHLPVIDQKEAVGHAVRAAYMYSGMADVAALTGTAAYIDAIDTIWHNVVEGKLYLTGGIGARHQGEAFGDDYELPNDTAYAETCAAIANAMWNHRMFLLHGDAKYMDVVERVIYNGFLSGISLSGDHFFYVNPLAWDGKSAFNRHLVGRQPWFDCSCCPSNVVRFLPSLPGYMYATSDQGLYVNLYIGGQAKVDLPQGDVTVTQTTDYPWDGHIIIDIAPDSPQTFALYLRIPGWAHNEVVPSDLYHYSDDLDPSDSIRLSVNGEPVSFVTERGYAAIERTWQPGDRVDLDLRLNVRRVASHAAVESNAGRVAIERGPIIYCWEFADNQGEPDNVRIAKDIEFTPAYDPSFLGGATLLTTQVDGHSLTLIPYHLWAHRGDGPMAVWLRG